MILFEAYVAFRRRLLLRAIGELWKSELEQQIFCNSLLLLL